MARCGSMTVFHPALRLGCSSVSAQLLGHMPGNFRSVLFNRARRYCAATCLSWEQRSTNARQNLSSRVTAIQSQQLGVSSRNLNDEQLAAVQTKEDQVRVLAGPGSGKTLVLTHRIAHLIGNVGVDPSDVLCVTFTNKAKGELLERLEKLLGKRLRNTITIETFHSLGAKILRAVADKTDAGVDRHFAIYDRPDSERILKKMLGSQLQGGAPFGEPSSQSDDHTNPSSSPRSIYKEKLSLISRVKEFDLRNFVAKQKNPHTVLQIPAYMKAGLPDFNRYQKILRSYNAVDFDDLIYLPVRILYQRGDLRQKYQDRWRYILADEFQDTDWAQLEFLTLLSSKDSKLFVVGDVDQAIYGFRGADLTIMGNLERQFPGLVTFELCRNYRSSPSILRLASEVMSRSDRSRISLRPLKLEAMKPEGPLVTITECNGPMEETSYVFDKIRLFTRRKDRTYGRFAILYRTNYQGKLFEQMCVRKKIPYTISGSIPFLGSKIIKDLRAYLQVICCPEDGVALARIINSPPRGLGPKTMAKVEQWAFDQNLSLSQALQA